MALDVARLLLRPTTELATTDIASSALDALYESSIRFLIFSLITKNGKLFCLILRELQESVFGRKTWASAGSLYSKRAS